MMTDAQAVGARPNFALELRPANALKASVCEETVRLMAAAHGARLNSLVLAGSLARDEATVVAAAGRWMLLGDADFLAVFHPEAGLPTTPDLQRICRHIEAALLRRAMLCRVTVDAAHPDYLRRLRPHIFGYELRCGEVVWGDRDALSLIPPFSASDIPLEDAWRLLCNRVIEQLEVVEDLTGQSRALSTQVRYRTIKLYLDMATSLLLFAGEYEPTYRGRAERLALLAARARPEDDYPFSLRAFSQRVAACTRWKLSPAEVDGTGGREFWEEAAHYARLLWRWELKRLLGTWADLPDRLLHQLWMRRQPFSPLIRGWLYMLRKQGWHRSWRLWPSWSRLCWQASPRYWVYAAASEVFFRLPSLLGGANEGLEAELHWEELGAWLPMRQAQPGNGLPRWRRLAAEIVWNYHEFLEGTRA